MRFLDKIVWIRADTATDQDERKKIVTTALENNFTNIIVKEEDVEVFKKLGKLELISITDNKIQLGTSSGEYIEIKDKTDQERAINRAGKTDYVLISAPDWTVIPIENLIAAYQQTDSKLLVEITEPKDAKLHFEILEVGVDGVVLKSEVFNKINELRKVIDEFEVNSVKLVPGKIAKMKSIGMGDRVCIDTCSMLNIGEGMLIGSQSNGLFLVHSESVESEYVASRPFRVNAGPVHSYILVPGDKTKYLSDLSAGDEVLVVDTTGKARTAVIGRIKIEKRPLLLVEVEVEDKVFNIILQNAETIRLISGSEPKSVVDLHEGDSILLWVDTSGRHFGMKVDESIVEK